MRRDKCCPEASHLPRCRRHPCAKLCGCYHTTIPPHASRHLSYLCDFEENERDKEISDKISQIYCVTLPMRLTFPFAVPILLCLAEIVLIFWGLIFMSRNQQPDMALRNVVKAAKSSGKVVLNNVARVSGNAPATSHSGTRLGLTTFASEQGEQRPQWDSNPRRQVPRDSCLVSADGQGHLSMRQITTERNPWTWH